jgi:hypothetical protein
LAHVFASASDEVRYLPVCDTGARYRACLLRVVRPPSVIPVTVRSSECTTSVGSSDCRALRRFPMSRLLDADRGRA